MSRYAPKPYEATVDVYDGDIVVPRQYNTGDSETLGYSSSGPPYNERRYLMRSPEGHYFQYGEYTYKREIVPLNLEEAMTRYSVLNPKLMGFKEAFPDVVEEDA